MMAGGTPWTSPPTHPPLIPAPVFMASWVCDGKELCFSSYPVCFCRRNVGRIRTEMALYLHWNGRIGQGMNLDSGQAVQAPIVWA